MTAAPATSAVDLDVAAYALRLGDDSLVLAQRLAEWATRSPDIEEDVALANVALDLLGQARSLLTYAGEAEGRGRDEDDLAMLRDPGEMTSVCLVELPGGDFGQTMARLLVFSSYLVELHSRLRICADPTLAAVAAKAVKEVDYHRDHAASWVVRLGDGTAESHARMQAGLDTVWPWAAELFEADELTDRLVARGVAVDPAALREPWEAVVRGVLAEATLTVPAEPRTPAVGQPRGRRGEHTEHLAPLLAEMQQLHRAHPGATW